MTQKTLTHMRMLAERINGILKQEFMIDKYNLDLKIMKQIVKKNQQYIQ
jgi:hypothetical protein